MNLGFTNKVAMVAGASRGLGYAVAHALAVEGAKVSIASRDEAAVAARLVAQGHSGRAMQRGHCGGAAIAGRGVGAVAGEEREIGNKSQQDGKFQGGSPLGEGTVYPGQSTPNKMPLGVPAYYPGWANHCKRYTRKLRTSMWLKVVRNAKRPRV